MNAIILDGKKLSEKILKELEIKIKDLKQNKNIHPTLATILVGENPSSKTYVNMKIKACESIGIGSKLVKLPQETTTNDLLKAIDELNNDPFIHGILLQHPCPPQIDERIAFERISFKKDVDGVTIESFGRLSMGMNSYFPCTPFGIILLLKEYEIELKSKKAVVVGRSPILGKPVAMMLLQENCTVTICHSHTKDLPEIVRNSDIVVGAVGKPEFIKADWIKIGAVLVDAGYNPGIVGDIELSKAKKKSSYYTPVPGGVGPMTISVLLMQTVKSALGEIA